MTANCTECGLVLTSLRHAKRHWRKEHAGETWTPEEYLPDTESEQRDFDGEEPDSSDYEPEYETENEPPETKPAKLYEFGDS